MTLSTLSEERLKTFERENGVDGKEDGDSTNSVTTESKPESMPGFDLSREEEEEEEEKEVFVVAEDEALGR